MRVGVWFGYVGCHVCGPATPYSFSDSNRPTNAQKNSLSHFFRNALIRIGVILRTFDSASPQDKVNNPARLGARRVGQNKEKLFAEGEWWSWGDLNPRPQAIFEQIYMFSGLI